MSQPDAPPAPLPAPRPHGGQPPWAKWLYLAYLLLYPLPWLRARPDAVDLLASAAGIAVFLWIYITGFEAGGRRRLFDVAAITAIGWLLLPFGGMWGVFLIYAAAAAGFIEPARRAVVAIALIAAPLLLAGLMLRWPLWAWAPIAFFVVVIGLSSRYSAAIEGKNRELMASRDEARRLAALAERERIARDLHDLLGHTLTVVAVKADLAGRLVDRDPARARAEIEEIQSTARAALADVRAAVTGMRSATFASELADARRALAAAGIDLEIDGQPQVLPPGVESVLAFALREGVTNVIRHAGARACTLRLDVAGGEARLELRDDGRGFAGAEGNGLAGLRERLAAVNGTLSLAPEDGTVLRATVPLGAGAAA
ncbi:MAG: sensor histidine kinase [Steroidobacteraceae bacterium]|jgi:two-component system sensor histidine kinase DesK|nr:sensor histidine kinase [Steroidobacteraceae bacterium]